MKKLIFGLIVSFLIVSSNFLIIVSSTNDKITYRDSIQVTCDLYTDHGVNHFSKDIPKTKFEVLMNQVKQLSSHIDTIGSKFYLKTLVGLVAIELIKLEIIPKDIRVSEIIKTISNKPLLLGESKLNQQFKVSEPSDHQNNSFCLVFGASNNKTGTFPWKMQFLLLPYILIKEFINTTFGIGNPYVIGPFMKLFLFRPKILIPIGSWFSYSSNATMVTIGVKGVRSIKDRGQYGLYNMDMLGFLGISVGSNSGGFIVGFCLYSDMYFNAIDEI